MIAGEEPHAGGFHGRDEKSDAAVGELPECGGALLLNFRVGREIFKRENIVRGQAQDFVGGERAGEFGGGEDVGVESAPRLCYRRRG